MNSCPPEIHAYICRLACFDEGSTVRALSLVNTYFHEIARPFRYQSLAVCGVDQIVALSLKLENTPPHLRHIRHLFISDQSNRKTDHQLGKNICDLESASITRILALAAPTLESLSFVVTCPSTGTSLIARLFRIPFPHLRELTIAGYYPFPSSPGNFPSLERLHLTGNRNPHGLLQMGGLGEACPVLSHLRISGLKQAVSFELELEQAFNGDESSMFPSTLPPQIRRVIIQQGPVPQTTAQRAAQAKEELVMKRLNELSAAARGQFVVASRSGDDILSHDIQQHWLDRLCGKEGCWAC